MGSAAASLSPQKAKCSCEDRNFASFTNRRARSNDNEHRECTIQSTDGKHDHLDLATDFGLAIHGVFMAQNRSTLGIEKFTFSHLIFAARSET